MEEQEIINQIKFYKKYRRLFQFGLFRRLELADGICWQVSQGSLHSAGLFHKLVGAAPGYQRLRVLGLKPNGSYRISNRAQLLRVGQFGALVKHISPVSIDLNGVVLCTADRWYLMEDGQESFTATGSALHSGVMLAPRFTGTGYDKALRIQGDFSSYLYMIKEETGHAGSQETK